MLLDSRDYSVRVLFSVFFYTGKFELNFGVPS